MQRISNLHLPATCIGLYECECHQCIDLKGICDQCKDGDFKSYIPPIWPCKRCIEVIYTSIKVSIKRVILALTTDCEEGNTQCMSKLLRKSRK